MKFAICNETFQDWPFDKAFALASECGYTGIEIAPFTIDEDARRISDGQRREIQRQAKAAGLEVVGLHWLLAKTQGLHLTSPEAEVRRETAEYLKELARLCRDLGGSVLVFGSPQQRNVLPGLSYQDAVQNAVEVFREVVPTLEDHQVVLALEPLGPSEGNFMNTAAEAVAMLSEIGSQWCRLHLDCKAMSSEAMTVPQVIRNNGEYLEHFHANDPNRLGPGFGDLDFEPIFQALQEIRYRNWVSVEVFDYSPGVERLVRESIDYMKTCLAANG